MKDILTADIMELFSRKVEEPSTVIEPRPLPVDLLRDELRRLVLRLLQQAGVSPHCVSVDIRHIGFRRDGRPQLFGMLRLVKWDKRSALRLVIGQAFLEKEMRKLLKESGGNDVCHFGGLWVHQSGALLHVDALKELRGALETLERADEASAAAARESSASASQSPSPPGSRAAPPES